MSNRIKLTDTPQSAIAALAEGNPGALGVLVDLLHSARAVDPDSMFGGIAPILDLDRLGIYGSAVWMLFKDVCEFDLVKMIACLRAVQLGLLTEDALRHAIENYGDGIETDAVLASVREMLPRFGQAA